jgi:hypothetical protein
MGSGFKVLGSGFWVLGSGFWVLGSRFRVLGSAPPLVKKAASQIEKETLIQSIRRRWICLCEDLKPLRAGINRRPYGRTTI